MSRASDYGSTKHDPTLHKNKRPTITELVLYEKQKKEDLESGRPINT